MTTTTKPFADTSIFQGVREWVDEDDQEFRAVRDQSSATWEVYVRRGKSFIFDCTVKAPRNASPRVIHHAWMTA